MASILRSIVAGPRARHPEAGLDLCYVTDNIIATSGPSGTYPQRAYRNPLDELVRFLDSKHGNDWAIWEFRAEGTGYPDSEVYGRVWHYPWPDHHPPPFRLIPNIVASMRNWLHDEADKNESGDNKSSKKGKPDRVVVVHCKAGKGRSGTSAVCYLISEEGWKKDDALQRFTERRMRPGMGKGVSIPSQLRWIDYAERWANNGKKYIDRMIQVLEVHVEGLRDGVKIAVEGFIDDGRTIKTFHVFKREERDDYKKGDETNEKMTSLATVVLETAKNRWKKDDAEKENGAHRTSASSNTSPVEPEGQAPPPPAEKTISKSATNVIFRPSQELIIPSNDINLAAERRSRAGYGVTMVTSVAHVWFNCFFEGNGPEKMRADVTSPVESSNATNGPDDSGVFSISWDAMDGIKGSSKKGMCAFDKVSILWRAINQGSEVTITEPSEGGKVQDLPAADWRGQGVVREDEHGRAEDDAGETVQRNASSKLGLRPEKADSANVSKASSVNSSSTGAENQETPISTGQKMMDAALKVKNDTNRKSSHTNEEDDSEDGAAGVRRGIAMPNQTSNSEGTSAQTDPEGNAATGNVEGGELRDRQEHALGDIKVVKKHDITSS